MAAAAQDVARQIADYETRKAVVENDLLNMQQKLQDAQTAYDTAERELCQEQCVEWPC